MKAFAFPLLLLSTISLIAPAGCVERELFIQTNPPAAEVWINGRLEGDSPLTLPFNYYGCRDVELRKEGYRAQRTHLELSSPWYQHFPFDFFFDVLWPGTLTDRHEILFELEPYMPKDIHDRDQILERAQNIKLKHLPSDDEE